MQIEIITISVDEPSEVKASEEWFDKWRTALSYLSENKACGCCINNWVVESPSQAIDELVGKMGRCVR